MNASKIAACVITTATVAITAPEIATAAPYCAADFCATLVDSPARDILSRTVTFRVEGKGIRNVELVPQYNYSPIVATFNTSPDGTFATLQLDTTQMVDQRMPPVRILAFDRPAGDATAHEILAMPVRTFYIRNTSSACAQFDTINHTSDGFPALLSGEQTTPHFCDPAFWAGGKQPTDCECALYQNP